MNLWFKKNAILDDCGTKKYEKLFSGSPYR